MASINNKELALLDKYFRASNYLSVGQLYLLDNPLLKRKLTLDDIKHKLVGHWGTVPGQNFIYTHLNRIIKKYDLNMMYISGPGHGGNSLIANTYLEGTYSEVYPNITYDEAGLQKLFKRFSFPGGVSSHVAPETPGSINEGGELGYSLAHAYGAVMDNPSLIAACVIGDGEAETGPLATAWHSNKFINPKTDGVVLPILHLNGYKIANPTIFGRMTDKELESFFTGCGYKPYFVEGDEPMEMHKRMASILDRVVKDIRTIKKGNSVKRPVWPMIILRTPKGWTGPSIVDGKQIEGSFRAHQIPLAVDAEHKKNLHILEKWLLSYHPEELFDKDGKLVKEVRDTLPKSNKRMGANPNTNGGLLLQELKTPDFKKYEVKVPFPGSILKSDMMEVGKYLRDVINLNKKNFRIFGPDETMSNRLNYVFEKTNRRWIDKKLKTDEFLAPDGRVLDSMLSEHMCEGWLEGYLLTGRHGIFNSYEAFIRIVDSMTSQHAKWLKVCNDLHWRRPIASLNYLLSSNVWQQDHNGFTHQDPGFLNHIATKKAEISRMYLPPDANCLLSCMDHCLKSKNYINVIIASKHPSPQWLSMDEAVKHCTKGVGIWKFASNDEGQEPDIVMASCGDAPTLETLAAISILKEKFPEIKIRMVNVVDLMKLQSNKKHPHGLTDEEYNAIFTTDKPIIFNFHGYPDLIHQLTYNRENTNIHVHGYIEEGTITTPFDMKVQNKIDRYHLVIDALKYLPKLGNRTSFLIQECQNKLIEHKVYIYNNGIDTEEIRNWHWK
jgi:xylulose-5-phosphate/fructose-6-phosphate phosphoketolase